MQNFHIAQINIARLLVPEGDPSNAFFFDNLHRINAVADRSQGFIWRLHDDSASATALQAFGDPLIIVNMSVWENLEALHAFAFDTVHKKIFERRAEFFEPIATGHAALWWIKAGTLPTIEEAKLKIETLAINGPTAQAFTFKEHFPPLN